jgi:hypothetical protein
VPSCWACVGRARTTSPGWAVRGPTSPSRSSQVGATLKLDWNSPHALPAQPGSRFHQPSRNSPIRCFALCVRDPSSRRRAPRAGRRSWCWWSDSISRQSCRPLSSSSSNDEVSGVLPLSLMRSMVFCPLCAAAILSQAGALGGEAVLVLVERLEAAVEGRCLTNQ